MKPRKLIIPRLALIGFPGTGKSTSASTLYYNLHNPAPRKPLLVLLLDPAGKELPYLLPCADCTQEPTPDGRTRTRGVNSKGLLRVVVEYFHDVAPGKPTAVRKLLAFLRAITWAEWGAAVLDSLTTLDIAARAWSRDDLNANNPDRQCDWNITRQVMEQVIYGRLAGAPVPTCCIAHIGSKYVRSEDGSDRQVHALAAPGQLQNTIGGAFTELYRNFILFDKKTGARKFCWQCQPGAGFECKSQALSLPASMPADWRQVEKQRAQVQEDPGESK